MKWWQTIDEHMVIRETCGYDVIAKVDIVDLPEVIHFLRICNNYAKLKRIERNETEN